MTKEEKELFEEFWKEFNTPGRWVRRKVVEDENGNLKIVSLEGEEPANGGENSGRR